MDEDKTCGNCFWFTNEDCTGEGFCFEFERWVFCYEAPCMRWKEIPNDDTLEVIKILESKAECMKREASGTDKDCIYRNCDECDLCYLQGTVGEQIEALEMAAEVLKKQGDKK